MLTVGTGAVVNVGLMLKVWEPGTVNLDGGTINAGSVQLSDGDLSGSGTLNSPILTNAGHVSPGVSAGLIDLLGDYVQDTVGGLAIELGGAVPGSGYDVLAVTGTAVLAGELSVSLINKYDPSLGTIFDILTAVEILGEFDTAMLPVTPSGYGFEIDYLEDRVRLTVVPKGVIGDLDGDGSVGVKDLLILLGNWGPCGDCNDCPADLDSDCSVGVKDLLILLGNWG